jgi:hemolysin activation/secretion protein
MKFGLSLSAQWTNDILPHSRQLVAGGFGNLTAWLPGIASGDRGGQFRAALNSPAIKDGAGTFSVSLFYEAGRVTTLNVGSVSPTQSLSDIGLGLVGDTPNLQYVFGYAHPLTADNTDEATQSLLRAHTFFNLTGKW